MMQRSHWQLLPTTLCLHCQPCPSRVLHLKVKNILTHDLSQLPIYVLYPLSFALAFLESILRKIEVLRPIFGAAATLCSELAHDLAMQVKGRAGLSGLVDRQEDT